MSHPQCPLPMRLLEKYLGLLSAAAEKLCDIACVILGFVVLGCMVLAIVTRYIDGLTPFLWTDELARYSMIWCAFLAASSALKKGQFLRFDLFVNALPERFIRAATLVSDILILIFCFCLLKYGYAVIPISFLQKSSALQLPMFYPYLAIIIGTLFMCLHVVFHLACECRFLLWGGDDPDSLPANEL